MATNGINAQVSNAKTSPSRRLSWLFSGVAIRILIAFVVSWMIILAFFVSGAVSH